MQKWCEVKGVSISRVLVDLQMSKGSISKWREGAEPTNRTKKQIADYFGITVRELLAGPEEKAPTVEVRANDEMAALLQEIRDRDDLRTLFMLASKTTPDEVRKFIGIIKALRGNDDGDGVC